MSDKIFVGIDLGKEGGICINKFDDLEIKVMPLTSDGALDINAVKNTLVTLKLHGESENIHVIFEDITPLHMASAKANWSLASQSGSIEAICICLCLKYTKVAPKIWQKEMFKLLPPLRTEKGSSDTKGLALIAVKILYPNINLKTNTRSNAKEHDGMVDSILLAEWGKRSINK